MRSAGISCSNYARYTGLYYRLWLFALAYAMLQQEHNIKANLSSKELITLLQDHLASKCVIKPSRVERCLICTLLYCP